MSADHRRRAALSGSRPRNSRAKTASRFRVARVEEIALGQSRKFLLPIRGADEECFVINFKGEIFAYVNRCRHVPMTMDWVDNQFFEESGQYLMCQTHNAYYEPGSGECIAGPTAACGKYLYVVPIEIDAGVIYALANVEEFED